jgi:DNA-directed RNA polymerase subunit RPC12/RpoP
MKNSVHDEQNKPGSELSVVCAKCGSLIPDGEDRQHYGKVMCEDCYMDALSPTRTCDPWAVHSAKQLGDKTGGLQTNPLQTRILEILVETGGMEPGDLARRLGIKPVELDREIASLRHMEKIRAELREGRKYIVLW